MAFTAGCGTASEVTTPSSTTALERDPSTTTDAPPTTTTVAVSSTTQAETTTSQSSTATTATILPVSASTPSTASTSNPSATGADPTAPSTPATSVAPPTAGNQLTVTLPAGTPGSGEEIVVDLRMPAALPAPLVVFAHGMDALPSDYAPLLNQLAAAGFVVAAPHFPGTRSDRPGGPNAATIVNQPGDVRRVLTELPAIVPGFAQATDGRVAMVGHSLGGVTALALVSQSSEQDSRISAAVILAGERQAAWPGDFAPTSTPLLFIHGTADDVIPSTSGESAWTASGPGHWWLALPGASHGSPFSDAAPPVPQAIRAFLGYAFDGNAAGVTELAALGATRSP